MEKAIAIPVGNQDGSLTLAEYLAKVPQTIRMRIKPSFLRDKGDAPLGSHIIIPVRLLNSHRVLPDCAVPVMVEKFSGVDTDAKAWLGDLADTREKAIALLPSKFEQPDGAYSYYVSQGFGYRLAEPATQTGKTVYASEQEREEKNFYVSLILPKDGPGYVEHWMTCKRRADNMVHRGEVKGTVYSRKQGLKLLEAHNRKFKDVPPK